MRSFKSFLFLCCMGGAASANGFAIAEQDATVTGRGNASVATDTDPSAIFYNPAGIAVGDGVAAEIGSSLVWISGSYTPTTGDKTNTDTPVQPVPSAFATARVHDMVSVGLGFTAPFGSAIDWPESSPITDVNYKTSLRTYFISGVVGLNLNKYVPGLTIGGGIDIVPATIEIQQNIFFGDTTGQAHLGGTATGVGGRVGAMYSPPSLPILSVGAMWRSGVKEDFSGTGDFDIAQPYRSQLPADGDIKASVTLPMAFTGGIAVRPIQNLEIEADVIWMQWSKFQQLDVTAQAAGNMTTTISTVENYKDTTSIRAGVEYKLPDIGLSLRAGYIYDPTPIKPAYVTAQLPDADRNDLCVGASYRFGDYAINASGLVVLPTSQTTETGGSNDNHQGKYEVSGVVASLSLTGRFGH